MNKKIKYLLECLNKAGHSLAYRKEMLFNDYFGSMTTKYNIHNQAMVKVNEGEEDEYEVPKIIHMLQINNDDRRHYTTLQSRYVSFTREIDLLVFLTEHCDRFNVHY